MSKRTWFLAWMILLISALVVLRSTGESGGVASGLPVVSRAESKNDDKAVSSSLSHVDQPNASEPSRVSASLLVRSIADTGEPIGGVEHEILRTLIGSGREKVANGTSGHDGLTVLQIDPQACMNGCVLRSSHREWIAVPSETALSGAGEITVAMLRNPTIRGDVRIESGVPCAAEIVACVINGIRIEEIGSGAAAHDGAFELVLRRMPTSAVLVARNRGGPIGFANVTLNKESLSHRHAVVVPEPCHFSLKIIDESGLAMNCRVHAQAWGTHPLTGVLLDEMPSPLPLRAGMSSVALTTGDIGACKVEAFGTGEKVILVPKAASDSSWRVSRIVKASGGMVVDLPGKQAAAVVVDLPTTLPVVITISKVEQIKVIAKWRRAEQGAEQGAGVGGVSGSIYWMTADGARWRASTVSSESGVDIAEFWVSPDFRLAAPQVSFSIENGGRAIGSVGPMPFDGREYGPFERHDGR
jgi:hypothetical protein